MNSHGLQLIIKRVRNVFHCSVGFHPRGIPSSGRTRRAADEETNPETPHELDRINLRKTIEVQLKDGQSPYEGRSYFEDENISELLVPRVSRIFHIKT